MSKEENEKFRKFIKTISATDCGCSPRRNCDAWRADEDVDSEAH